MKISCQSCHSKYNVADEKIQGKIVKIRCRKCGATIVVNASGGASRNGSAPAPPASEAAEGPWHVSVSDNDQRTMTLAEIVSAYNAGVVGQDTFVWTEGMADWKALADVEAVVSALHAAAAPVPAASAPLAAPERRTSPAGAAAAPPAAFAAPPLDAPPQIASSFERPPTGGAFDPQSPAPPVETKRAAVKREVRAKDLFATRTGEELQMSTPSAEDDARLTGQRNENSVLFSLEHLSKNTDQPPSFASQSFGGHKDDSGLIDLKALAAKAESMRPPAMHEAPSAPLGVAPPLGFAAPLGGLAMPADSPKSRLPLLIGGGAGVALLLVLGIVIGLKIGGAAAPAPVASANAFALPPLPTASAEAPAPTASARVAAQPSASTSTAPVVAAKPRPVAPPGGVFKPGLAAGVAPKPPGPGPAAAGATSPAGAAAPAAPAAAAPAKKGDCGCNGDLMCMMKCSTH